jgi:hypothetical protein
MGSPCSKLTGSNVECRGVASGLISDGHKCPTHIQNVIPKREGEDDAGRIRKKTAIKGLVGKDVDEVADIFIVYPPN